MCFQQGNCLFPTWHLLLEIEKQIKWLLWDFWVLLGFFLSSRKCVTIYMKANWMLGCLCILLCIPNLPIRIKWRRIESSCSHHALGRESLTFGFVFLVSAFILVEWVCDCIDVLLTLHPSFVDGSLRIVSFIEFCIETVFVYVFTLYISNWRDLDLTAPFRIS